MRGGKHTATRHAAVVLIVMALTLLGWAASVTAGTRSTPNGLAAGVATAINEVRAGHGRRQLRPSAGLRRAARAHVASMGRKGYFSHSSAGGGSFGSRLLSYYGSAVVGEVIYWQQGVASARQVVSAWLASDPHRADLLARRWRQMGVATIFVENAPGVYRGRDVTLVVVDFGARR